MDMGSDNMVMGGSMKPYLHFTGGDNLYFKSWLPSSKGAIAGACIALVALAILERWISAMRGAMVASWRRSAMTVTTAKYHATDLSTTSKEQTSIDVEELDVQSLPKRPGEKGALLPQRRSPRMIPPFIATHDIPRGAMYAAQALLAYALMLAVMSFQAAFIISIILGLGIGEVLFGRLGGHGQAHPVH
ncbi:hypothetical protein CERSUDRAFT_79342 [Gelatoporia subvermispora B]|uniref:Copper transport protein n=1 Tax=Ceriporiopsis subvermispora (strain B) TaxID=914234 RepID=M2PXR4_CERS8|nr:hypothetical protein CERSUDRAFT_79342 [Gelatoporia subvermispora B]